MSYRRKKPDQTGRTKTGGARSPAERLEPGRAPTRPRGFETREPSRVFSGLVRVTSSLFTLALVGMLSLGALGVILSNQYERPGPLDTARNIVIPKGEGRIAIAERLEKEGIIANRWTFVAGHVLQNAFGARKSQELKAGEYEVKEHASMRQVMETLSEGKSILYKMTMPEGLTSQQVVERLKAEPNLTGDVPQVPAEGTLLPDTYHFSKGLSRKELVDRMQNDMQKALAALWEKRAADLPFRSPDEVLIFASIVEKETGRPDERDKVSAVFHNRLKKGMRLQSDPTIIYGIAAGQGTLGRSITRADIDSKTPYNTYQINGLPPGPICNPGKASLEAALSPAKTNDLYFVADGTGGHAFTENLKDHNAAVQKWRETEKQAKAKTGTAGSAEPDPDVTPIPASGDDPGPEAPAITQQTAAAAKKAPAVVPASAAAPIPLPTRKPKKQ
jgi:UPF0755 protein